MKKTAVTLLFLINPLLCLAASLESQPSKETWHIESRALPLPASASPLLKQAIHKTPVPDIAEARKKVPAHNEQWLALAAENERERGAYAADFAKQHGLTITKETLGGVIVRWIMPARVAPEHKHHLFIEVHGGGFVFNGGEASVIEAVMIAARLNIPVLSIDYRLLPAHPFPAAIDDIINVYQTVLTQYKANTVALGGTSAGGNLAMAAIQKMAQLRLEKPGVLYLGTPWSDLTKTSDTLFINEGIDRILVTYDGWLKKAAHMYADGKKLNDPMLSPVYGEFDHYPPTYLVTGTRDLLLSDTARTHRKLKEAGIEAELNVYEGLSHADYLFVFDSPESKQLYKELNQFLLKNLKK